MPTAKYFGILFRTFADVSSMGHIKKCAVILLNKWSNIGVRARGAGGAAAPPDSGNSVFFRAKAKFFGQKPAAKNHEKMYLLNEKRHSFRPAR